MSVVVVLAIIGAVLGGPSLEAQAPSLSTSDASTVQQTLIDLYRAVSARDAARYRTLCTRDFVRLERGELMGLDRAVASFATIAVDRSSRTDQLAFRSTRIVGNTASSMYVRATRIESGGRVEQQRWEESAQLIRSGGRWRVSMLHANPLEPDGSIAFLPPWTKSLPIQPGDSLKNQIDDGKDKQVVTLFRLDEVREVGGSTFISGSGYIEINGGGTTYSGLNRAQDPFIELTITAPESPVFRRCEELLTQESLVQNAIRIGGEGYFLPRPGIKGRRLGVVRLDSVTQCELVPRR